MKGQWLMAGGVLALLLGGCVFAPGDAMHGDGGQLAPTLGAQLIDLDRARDQGAIGGEEYQRARQRLLDGDY